MALSLSIRLDDLESFHTSGDLLKGNVLLSVTKRISLRHIKLETTCDVDSSLEVNLASPGKKPKLRVFKSNMRLYEKEVTIPLRQHHYEEGEYEIPFEFPLPSKDDTLPPSATNFLQPNTFGNINYTLKAQVKRSGSSWFSNSGETKAFAPFLFMPHGLENQRNSGQVREEPFNGIVPGSTDPPKKGVLSSIFGKKPQPLPPLELKGVFSYPLPGISQGIPEKLGLRIQTGSPEEQIILKSFSLTLETVLILRSKGNTVQRVIKSEPLIHEQLLRSDDTIQLNDVLAKVHPLMSVVPTFETPVMAYHHQVCIDLLLLRQPSHKSSNVLKYTQRIPVKVLPPTNLLNSSFPVEKKQILKPLDNQETENINQATAQETTAAKVPQSYFGANYIQSENKVEYSDNKTTTPPSSHQQGSSKFKTESEPTKKIQAIGETPLATRPGPSSSLPPMQPHSSTVEGGNTVNGTATSQFSTENAQEGEAPSEAPPDYQEATRQ